MTKKMEGWSKETKEWQKEEMGPMKEETSCKAKTNLTPQLGVTVHEA